MTRRGAMLRLSESEFDAHRRSPNGYVDTRPEVDVQRTVLDALRKHPRVAWCHRFNAAAGQLVYPDGKSSRFMRFGFKGLSDILGQLRDGRFLAVEVKRYGEKLKPDQHLFLEAVVGANGVGFVARSVEDVFRELEK